MYALRSQPCAAAADDDDADDAREGAARAGRQPAHSDAPWPVEPGATPLQELADADMPLSAMLAVQPGTRLWVWPAGCDEEGGGDERGDDGGAAAAEAAKAAATAPARAAGPAPPVLVELELGDLLVWRGDLVHAGAGYPEEHVVTRVVARTLNQRIGTLDPLPHMLAPDVGGTARPCVRRPARPHLPPAQG